MSREKCTLGYIDYWRDKSQKKVKNPGDRYPANLVSSSAYAGDHGFARGAPYT
jgi:hypothetical protein